MICPGCGHSSHTPFACAAQDSCLCATCPGEAQHGNPFRYCPVKGCAWMEERPTGPACTSQATAILGAPCRHRWTEPSATRCACDHGYDGNGDLDSDEHTITRGEVEAARIRSKAHGADRQQWDDVAS